MREPHDEALADEHAATDRDHEAKAIAERLEDERLQLQAFADWMEQYSGESCEAQTLGDEAFLPIVLGDTLRMLNGRAVPISSRNLTPYRALWAIYEKEIAARESGQNT